MEGRRLKSIKKKKEFSAVLKNGKRKTTRRATVFIGSSQETMLGIIVTRKLGGAVKRNRIKRRTKEAFKRIWQQLPHPIAVVVLPKASVDKCKFEEIVESLKNACNI